MKGFDARLESRSGDSRARRTFGLTDHAAAFAATVAMMSSHGVSSYASEARVVLRVSSRVQFWFENSKQTREVAMLTADWPSC